MTNPKPIDAKTLHTWFEENNVTLIDVREQYEYEEEHIPGSMFIPLSDFKATNIPNNPKKKLVFHCKGGSRSDRACRLFLNLHPDIEAYNLEGGIMAWKAAGFPTEKL